MATERGLFNAVGEDPELTTSNVVVGRTSLSRLNWRLVIALLLGAVLWIGPYIGSIGILLPALLQEIAPDDKVALVGAVGVIGAVLALVANIVFGALSDVTRSRMGRRGPWILGGAVVGAVALFGMSTTMSVPLVFAWWCLYILGLNAIVASMVAVISDRVSVKYRGTVSAVYGVGFIVGSALSQIVGASFLENASAGLILFALCTLASGVQFILIAPEGSNRGEAGERLTARRVLASFALPRRGARDFYLALAGKFLLQAGGYAITNYQLYILTDYIGLDASAAGGIISIAAVITLVTGLVFGVGSGPLSDRLGRRKPFVIASALLIAIGAVFPAVAPFAWGYILFAVCSGIGNGVFSSVDQALNIEVLPDKENAAKDLGLLNVANTGGQIIGPVVTSFLVVATGGYQASFAAAGVLLVGAALCFVPIRKVR
ncbi:MFS transporter [Microbacterium gilvum]|uniref:MFS transporter n=1 Tax=Microbacterium gilvum TaxID=1336204 RepID=A0ABP9A0K9_9MICO